MENKTCGTCKYWKSYAEMYDYLEEGQEPDDFGACQLNYYPRAIGDEACEKHEEI